MSRPLYDIIHNVNGVASHRTMDDKSCCRVKLGYVVAWLGLDLPIIVSYKQTPL